MPVIIKRPRARSDLAEIWDYIADDNETRADAFVDTIDSKFHLLAGQPDIGRVRNDLADGMRSFPVGRYVIFYRVVPKGVEIVRVLHGARDVDALFSQEN